MIALRTINYTKKSFVQIINQSPDRPINRVSASQTTAQFLSHLRNQFKIELLDKKSMDQLSTKHLFHRSYNRSSDGTISQSIEKYSIFDVLTPMSECGYSSVL